MDEQIIVLVSDRDDSKHGEISVLDDPQKAERLVETLLEAGFDKERIRVFVGRASEFQISHRPVVALGVGAEEAELEQPAKPESRGGDGRDEAAPEWPRKTAAKPESRGGGGRDEAAPEWPRKTAGKIGADEAAVEAAAPVATAKASLEAAAVSRGQEEPALEASEAEEAPTDEAAEPVKFSSLFRSA